MPGAPTRLIAKKKWTRRDLLKLAQIGGVGAVGAGLAFGGRADAEVQTRRGLPALHDALRDRSDLEGRKARAHRR